MEIKKEDFNNISNLIFQSYLTTDIFILNTYITIRSLDSNQIDEISNKYKYLKNTNFYLIIDVLSKAIINIGGIKVTEETIRPRLLNSNSKIVSLFYDEYIKLVNKLNQYIEIFDIYIETNESIKNWKIFKNFNKSIDINSINQFNTFQKNWILTNLEKDKIENTKHEWQKVAYMTSSICAFSNPQAYNKNKNSFNLMKQYEDYDYLIKENKEIAEDIEKYDGKNTVNKKEKEYINADQELFAKMGAQPNETKQQHAERISNAVQARLKGEVLDEHDKVIKQQNINKLKMMLYERRKNTLIARKMKQSQNIEDEEILGGLDEIPQGEFCYEGVDYSDLINYKYLILIKPEEKQQIFKEVMNLEINIEKEIAEFQKSLYQNHNDEDIDSIGFMPQKGN